MVNSLSFAQNDAFIPHIQHFTVTEGLSHREVLSIFESQNGIIWIGTRNGLNRFDGYTFKHYLGKNHGVDLRGIRKIGQDNEGWLWLYGRDELSFFNPQTEKFQSITERFGTDCILNQDFFTNTLFGTFPTDNDGRLYIEKIHSNHIYTYHSSEGFKIINLPFTLLEKHVFTSVSDKGELRIHYSNQNKKRGATQLTLSKDFQKSKNYTINNELVIQETDLINYNNNQVWSRDGFFITEVLNEKREKIISLRDKKIEHFQSMFFDRQNRAWISTSFGFYIVDIQKAKFNFLASNSFANGNSARGILVNKEALIVVSEPQGISSYNFKTQESNTLEGSEWNRAVYAFDDGFWIGSKLEIAYWKDGKAEKYPIIKILNNEIYAFDFWNITPSRLHKNTLWLGSSAGLYRFNTETKKHQLIQNPSFKDDIYLIQNIVPDKENQNWLWLCTNKGLILFDEKTEEFIAIYNLDQSEDFRLPSEYFQHLYQDNDGIYWLATAGDGVIRWNKKTQEFQQFTIKDGLPNDVIYVIYSDDFGNIWMSSDNGIIQMNKTTFAIQNFLLEDGIGQSEFNRISHTQYRQNGLQRLFFGGLNGITSFYPKDFQQKNAQTKPLLSLLRYQQFNNQEQTVFDYTLTINTDKKIILKPNDYIYNFEVGLLNYDNVTNNQYIYQLNINGNSADWKVQKSRTLQLGQLPYGKHQLIVKAKTIANVESVNELRFEIIVQRPFYLTWWFILMTILSLIIIIYFWAKYRTKQFEKRQKILEILVDERTDELRKDKEVIEKQAEALRNLDTVKSNFFANVSHELRTPLTLMMGPMTTIEKSQNLNPRNLTLLQIAQQNGQQLLRLINEILDLGKLEAGKLKLESEDVLFYPLVKRIATSFKALAQTQKKRFVFDYQLDRNLQIALDVYKFEIILNNFLSNAFKYTSANHSIFLTIKRIQSKIRMEVRDEGRGIHEEDLADIFNRYYQTRRPDVAAEGGTGIGLATCYEFAKLFNGETWVESELDKGSTFYFEFPYQEILMSLPNEHLSENQLSIEIISEKSIPKTFKSIPKGNSKITLPTILVVEDNSDLSKYLQLILQENYNVVTAFNGQEAIELITNLEKKVIPNLIISDLMMPIMDGFQLLDYLKSNSDFRQIPVVMLTAKAASEDKIKALRIGVDDYLLKPFQEDELLVRIENLLANYDERKAFTQVETEEENVLVISETDQKWLKDVEELVLKKMTDLTFSNEYLAELLFIHKKTLYRKIKSFTGLTPTKYIRAIRLQQAKLLLEQGHSVKIVAQKVGFQSTEYFSSLFKKEFGKKPSEYGI